MNKRLVLLLLSLFLSLAAVNAYAHQEPATNKDGSVVTNVLTASFDPFGQSSGRAVAPYPSNLGFFALDAEGNLVAITIEHAKLNGSLPNVEVREVEQGAA